MVLDPLTFLERLAALVPRPRKKLVNYFGVFASSASYCRRVVPLPGGFYDGFVALLDPRLPSSQQLVYSSFLGGSESDWLNALFVDASGVATVAGRTRSIDFPATPGAWDTTHNGTDDAYVARLDPRLPSAQQLVYSTFLGGSTGELANALSVDAAGAATVVGMTSSTDFPTTPGAWDRTYTGGQMDAFVARLDFMPTGVRPFGISSPGCTGPLAIGVTSIPRIGNAGFTITCNHAPPNAAGVLLLAALGRTSPFRFQGIEIWMHLGSEWLFQLPIQSNTEGGAYSALPLPLDPLLVSQRLNAQFVWTGPMSPPPCPQRGLSASNALEITIQP